MSYTKLCTSNPPANVRYVREECLIAGSGTSPGEGNGTPLQYSCLGNPMDRGTCPATVAKELDKTYGLNNDKQQLGEEDFR